LVGLLKDCSSKKLRTMKQQQDSYADYIGYDLGGYAYNKKISSQYFGLWNP
jgi:hypothetical protein